MTWVLIIHDVDDYAAWKRIFDNAASLRHKGGERSFQVLRSDINDTRIVHFAQWTSHDDARAFFESDAIRRIREEAGVHPPTFLYLDELDAGEL